MLPESIKFFDLPLLERLYRRQYHLMRLRGDFNLTKLVRDYRPQLVRSDSSQNTRGSTGIERLMFDLGNNVFVVYDMPELLVYAPTTKMAAEVVAQLNQYRKPQVHKPSFKLICVSGGQPCAQPVRLQQVAPWSEQELGLHYGDDFLRWEASWL